LADALQTAFDSGVRLILIAAPAGSGKSILAGQWANAARHAANAPRFAWLALDPADNEKLRFWRYLIGALQTALPGLGQAEQRMLAFSEAPPVESILTGLLNQIGARAERVVLTLDDYHVIAEPSIHEGITFLLEHLPANMQLLIATRADPPLPLHRLRVRGQLLEIRAADLLFTLPETETLINARMGLGLSREDLAVLEERTEGWAAGVQLAAVLMQDERRKAQAGQVEERLSALITRLSGRHHLIADYLVDEVLNRQSAEVQRFLLNSSVLDALCAPLCDAVLREDHDPPGSQAVLAYLDHANLFLIPLDEAHTWFRYHHLFAEALRVRLEQTRPGAAARLHQRASRWYEQQGYPEEAIHHALAARDHPRAADLIEANAGSFARQGRYAALLRWVDVIPAETLLAHPRLQIFASRALALSGKLSDAEQQLQTLEAATGAAALTPELRGQIAAVRATAAILNADAPAAQEQSRRAIDLLPPGDPARAGVMLSLGDAALISGDIPRGIELLRETVLLCRQTHDLSILLTACAHLGEGLWMQGKLRQVEAVCLEALEEVSALLGAGDWPLPSLALIYTLLGGIRREWDDLDAAEQALSRAVNIAETSSYISAMVNAYTGMAVLRRSQGNLPQAIQLVEKGMRAIPRRESELFLAVSQALRADYWAQSGNTAAAQRWAEERHLSADRAIDYLGEYELYALARLWISVGRADEADALTARLVAYAQANGRSGRAIDSLVLQAVARHAAGRPNEALRSLKQALALVAPEGYTRSFLDEGAPLAELLRRITRQKSPAAEAARGLLVKAGTPSAPDGPAPLVEPLTEREMAVLRQVAAGASNQEIARNLVISIGTVKAHVYHITAKLGARSRTEAVARVREAGYLE
jgi:LuxR family maltose regulon positive regulatory protein